ncbi:HD domain-containing protein (plasmid) [Paenibacillus urinalis]|uniref:HD domain-containing protein n=1 Tax=Paenibacillus urinalis TaxID=521520 RepID=A0AAX3N7R1_9BACL|nr:MULTISPECIES: HD domain-containing phosphohydrolase [Paenibacillus]MCM3130495.1 HD domain-containing protein [Paenibacillus sp. MER 78]WDH85381.1 HD domain-containing protein [Paenibacillus urinalis]WDH95181.1 HD domain-containing protein [Paenibacillus urinalis]WDI05346.1 HD domain-containing protein [Paenibacillus urinalis]
MVNVVNPSPKMNEQALKSYLMIIDALFYCIKLRDEQTANHSVLMAHYSYKLAQIHDPKQSMLYYAGSLIHDLGKIAMGDDILKGNGVLSTKDKACLSEHVQKGIKLIESFELPSVINNIVEYHHERFDGSGYLKGLKGKQIPLSGRIAAISDTFSTIIGGRPYQSPLSAVSAIKIMEEESFLFDAAILRSLIELVEQETEYNQSVSTVKIPWSQLSINPKN